MGLQDLTQELLKLSLIYTALELSDKVGGGEECLAGVVPPHCCPLCLCAHQFSPVHDHPTYSFPPVLTITDATDLLLLWRRRAGGAGGQLHPGGGAGLDAPRQHPPRLRRPRGLCTAHGARGHTDEPGGALTRGAVVPPTARLELAGGALFPPAVPLGDQDCCPLNPAATADAAVAPPLPQAMVFGVAMNSQKNTLVALLIAANFTEIKGGRRSV